MKLDLDAITYLMAGSLVVATIFGFSLIKKLSLPFKLIVFQLFIGTITETIGLTLQHYGENNSMEYNIYILLECCLLLLAIIALIQQKGIRNILFISLCIFIGFWVCSISLTGMNAFAVYPFILSCILLTLGYLLLIIRMAKKVDNLLEQPIFWLSVGIVVYFGPDIPLFSMFNYFKAHGKEKLGSYLYTINDVLGILRYLLTIYGFYLCRRRKFIVDERY